MNKNIYNFDEKRFMIKDDITSTQIISLEEMRSEEIIGISQDGNKEWILLLIAIYVIIIKILFYFIYWKELGDLRDT